MIRKFEDKIWITPVMAQCFFFSQAFEFEIKYFGKYLFEKLVK